MTKYKITRFNIGFGDFEYSIARVDGIDLVPVIPIRYYKTITGAKRRIKQLKKN